jgi:hypothetical protein
MIFVFAVLESNGLGFDTRRGSTRGGGRGFGIVVVVVGRGFRAFVVWGVACACAPRSASVAVGVFALASGGAAGAVFLFCGLSQRFGDREIVVASEK